MVRVYKNSLMEIFIKEGIKKENHMALVNITGAMEATSKEILRKESEMAMEFGKRGKENLINTKVSI
jgi:hypothetical protein